ncbi:MAG: efflux RND transporter periplasmic adaptor subunit [Sphingobacteriales bacterium]|nr:MAG: efflux RND transporter periplasmic adaptor subunit [Sphingobacteriales bacterium]
MKRRKIIWIVIAAVLALILLIAIGRSKGDSGARVAVEAAGLHTITESVTANGKIYPEQEVKISPEVSGEIIELRIREGDSVSAGQLLARINPATYSSVVSQAEASVMQSRAGVNANREQVAQARAQMEQARSTYNRNQQLYREKVISAQEFEQAEASYKSARATFEAAQASASGGQFGVQGASANLAQAQANLRKTTLFAPVSGIIAALNVKLGERVVGTAQMAGTEMMTIANLGRMEVRVDVSETEIAKVKVGDSVRVQADAYRGQTFGGIVSHVSVSSKTSGALAASTDQVTNYTVRILLNPQPAVTMSGTTEVPHQTVVFKPGMSASVDILTRQEREVLSVPVNAVTTRDYPDSLTKKQPAKGIRQVVFVLDRKTNTVILRDVTTGIQDNNYLQILSGLRKGEEIVIAPYSAIARTLKDGARIQVVKKEALFAGETKTDETP